MVKCLICAKNLENHEKKCSVCGFDAKMPVFLSEEQYMEWNREIVIPYMNEFMRKKVQLQEELLKHAREIAQEISEKAAAEIGEKSAGRLAKTAVEEAASKMKGERKVSLQKKIEGILNRVEIPKDSEEKSIREYVVFLQEQIPGRKEEIIFKGKTPVKSEEWDSAKEKLRASFKNEQISLKEEQLQSAGAAVAAEVEKVIAAALKRDKLPEVIKISEMIFKDKGESEESVGEIRERTRKIFREVDEISKQSFGEQTENLARENLKKAFELEERKVLERVEALVQKVREDVVDKTGASEPGKTMCVFGMDFYVAYHENAQKQVSIFGEDLGLARSLGKWTDLTAIAAGSSHITGLQKSGKVVSAGDNNLDQCDTGDWRDIVQIASCGANTAALDSDGRVHVCGSDEELSDAGQWRNIKKIALGIHHILGLRQDGTVVAAGYNDDDQCEVGRWKSIVDIAAGEYHSLGITASGAAVAAGSNLYGECEVSDWRNVVMVKAGNRISAGLQKDGKVCFAGEELKFPEVTGKVLDLEVSQCGELRCYYKVKTEK